MSRNRQTPVAALNDAVPSLQNRPTKTGHVYITDCSFMILDKCFDDAFRRLAVCRWVLIGATALTGHMWKTSHCGKRCCLPHTHTANALPRCGPRRSAAFHSAGVLKAHHIAFCYGISTTRMDLARTRVTPLSRPHELSYISMDIAGRVLQTPLTMSAVTPA